MAGALSGNSISTSRKSHQSNLTFVLENSFINNIKLVLAKVERMLNEQFEKEMAESGVYFD